MLSKKGLGGLTRRGWLQSTGLIVAVGAFSRLKMRASTEISPVMDKLSTYMTEARHRELPVKVLQETEHHIGANQVQHVTVRAATSAAYTVNNRDMPDICLQHLVAIMLLDRTVSFRAAHDKARMQDPAVLGLRAKVHLVPDENLEKLIPVRVAIVEGTLKDGAQLSERVDAVRGTPDNPMPRDEVIAKTHDLMAPVLGAAACSKLIERMLELETVKDIQQVRPLLQNG